MKSTQLAYSLSNLAEILSENQLTEMAHFLCSGTIRPDSPSTVIEDLTDIHGSTLQSLVSIVRKWEGPPSSLASCLEAIVQMHHQRTDSDEMVSLVWTGPVQFAIPTRSTIAVTREMVGNAKQDVTILGYRITAGAKPVFQVLAMKSDQGVRVRIILDQARSQLRLLSRLWPAGSELPEVFDSVGEGALHAKLTLVDGNDMLITSANLTYHGLRSNIEVGVRIKGRASTQVNALISLLIEEGYFKSLA